MAFTYDRTYWPANQCRITWNVAILPELISMLFLVFDKLGGISHKVLNIPVQNSAWAQVKSTSIKTSLETDKHKRMQTHQRDIKSDNSFLSNQYVTHIDHIRQVTMHVRRKHFYEYTTGPVKITRELHTIDSIWMKNALQSKLNANILNTNDGVKRWEKKNTQIAYRCVGLNIHSCGNEKSKYSHINESG